MLPSNLERQRTFDRDKKPTRFVLIEGKLYRISGGLSYFGNYRLPDGKIIQARNLSKKSVLDSSILMIRGYDELPRDTYLSYATLNLFEAGSTTLSVVLQALKK
jgi:hypothetical protein